MAKYYNNNNHYDQPIPSSLSSSSSRTLEITILSGEDLRLDRRPIKKNAFVTVRSSSGEFQSTAVDELGGNYPNWNEKLVLNLPANSNNSTSLLVEVRCKTGFSGDKIIGEASIPMSDCIGGYVPESCIKFLSYRLRNYKGERSGIINISVRTTKGATNSQVYTCSAAVAAADRSTMGVPVGKNSFRGQFGGSSSSSSVVTGIPVWLSHNNRYNGHYF